VGTTTGHRALDSFQISMLEQTQNFSVVCSKYFSALLSCDCKMAPTQFLEQGINSQKNMIISVLFTGSVFGEYVVALDEETAAQIINETFINKTPSEQDKIRKDIIDTFSEILNLAVGECIVSLNKIYKKLTVTTPKVTFGKVKYPQVKSAHNVLHSNFGTIECFLFVDRMKLDISDAYKDALSSLEKTNIELVETLRQLQEQQEQIVQSEKLAALGTMAAGVAHEINTPLATISMVEGNLQELLKIENDFDRAEVTRSLEIIQKTVFRIAKITNALRDYARSDGSESKQDVSIRYLLNDALIFCQSQIKDKGIKIIADSLNEETKISCRPQQLSQVIYNLLINSLDAIEEMPGDKWIKIEAKEIPGNIEIRITDSGFGMSEEVQKKAFDPFYTTKTFGKGTGLGLSICKGILEIHKGRIFINPNSQHTQFVIEIPISAALNKAC